MARSTARKRALNTLYEADEKSQDILFPTTPSTSSRAWPNTAARST